MQFVVGDWNTEARAEKLKLFFVQLLLLMRDVLAFSGFAQAVAFDGFRQNDGWSADVIDGGAVGGVNFNGIVATEAHARQLFVREMLDHFQQAGVCAEQFLSEVGSAFDVIFLILSVSDFAAATYQDSVTIVADEAVPVGAPDAFDDVPSSAAEDGFEFLDDFSVAAYGSIETLQVAVDNEDQIVEIFAGSERDGTERLGFIHFAIAQERPNFSASRLLKAAILQIADKARVVNRLNRSKPHGNGGELPEVRHEPGVRIGTEATTGFQFAAKIFQLFFWNAAFEIGAGIDSGRGMALEINEIAVPALIFCFEEMVKCHLILSCGRGEGGDVTANAFLNLIGAHHHGERIPADEALDAAFHLLAAGERGLLKCRNRVLVRRGCGKGEVHTGGAPGMQRQLLNQAACAYWASALG